MIVVTGRQVTEALAHIGTLGPYFATRTEATGQDRPLARECADRTLVGSRLHAARESLGTAETRVAASSVQYELAERLWAVLVAAWSHHRLVLDVSHFRVGPGLGSWDLSVPAARACRADQVDATEVAPRLASAVVDNLRLLHRTMRSWSPIAEGLLWGNAATAATLALRGIRDEGPRQRAVPLVTTALADNPLRDRFTGTVDGPVTRRSCCLYYRTRDPRPCGDCPLTGSTVTKMAAASAETR